jgi:hypothetical protein
VRKPANRPAVIWVFRWWNRPPAIEEVGPHIMDHIRWRRDGVSDCLVVRPVGVLKSVDYRDFRDTMVKFAVEQPRAVVVVIDGLDLRVPNTLSAFASAALHVSDWPGVPIVVVTGRDDQRAALKRAGVRQFVSIFGDVAAAVDAAAEPPRCRRRLLELGPELISAWRARLCVRATCERWGIADVIRDAEQIATELVENAVLHARSRATLRLELRIGLLTVAVSDESPREAVLLERVPGTDRGIGLRIVADRARTWGCSPRSEGGKVVWAVLRVPGAQRLEPPL